MEFNEFESYRPTDIKLFLEAGLPLEPESDEFQALQRLDLQKHNFDTDVARRHRSCNRFGSCNKN